MNEVLAIGADWPQSSLIWGGKAGLGAEFEQMSPVDGSLIQRVRLLSEDELQQLVLPQATLPPYNADELQQFCGRLHLALSDLSDEMLEALQLETGFINADCRELVEGSLVYARDFPNMLQPVEQTTAAEYETSGQTRHIRIVPSPIGTIAVILPQNAFLLVAVTCLLNALAAGNRVLLRAPMQSARSAALLSRAIQIARPPRDAVSMVVVRAKPFVGALHQSPLLCLLHYMGSSRHAAAFLSESFENAKPSIVDGEGNVWVWVGADTDPNAVADTLTEGALRYNGQTCTSINGALIHPDRYEQVRELLIARWSKLKAGNPIIEDVTVGPLLDEAQSAWCQQRIEDSGGQILCGGERQGNLLQPTLIENPLLDSELVTQGLFGAALWIRAADEDEFAALWPCNRFPLCVGVLSASATAEKWLPRLPRTARLLINGDPSVEYLFEPWGGYPSSGVNPVSLWVEKYQRLVAIDEPINLALQSTLKSVKSTKIDSALINLNGDY